MEMYPPPLGAYVINGRPSKICKGPVINYREREGEGGGGGLQNGRVCVGGGGGGK